MTYGHLRPRVSPIGLTGWMPIAFCGGEVSERDVIVNAALANITQSDPYLFHSGTARPNRFTKRVETRAGCKRKRTTPYRTDVTGNVLFSGVQLFYA